MKVKNKKSIKKNEFRKNKVTRHPAYVYEKEGNYYKNIGITHSQKTHDEENEILNKNPDPFDTQKIFARPYPEKTRVDRFSKKLYDWELDETDKETMERIKKRRFRP